MFSFSKVPLKPVNFNVITSAMLKNDIATVSVLKERLTSCGYDIVGKRNKLVCN